MLYYLLRWLKKQRRYEVYELTWDVSVNKPTTANFRCPVCDRDVMDYWKHNTNFNCPACGAKLFYERRKT